MRREGLLINLTPSPFTSVIHRDRTVLVTGRDGFIAEDSENGLFVHQTRMLSRYRHLINGKPWRHVASSSVEQHSWMGYYITFPPGADAGPPDMGSGQVPPEARETVELRLSRRIGSGMREDVFMRNYSRHNTSFVLSMDIDADFVDQAEPDAPGPRRGRTLTRWIEEAQTAELIFDHQDEHRYEVQRNEGVARIHRAIAVVVVRSSSPPAFRDGQIAFDVRIPPQGSWEAAMEFIPKVEELDMPVSVGEELDVQRRMDELGHAFLAGSTSVSAGASDLSADVFAALDQAKRDLASLRLFDQGGNGKAWTLAAGAPIYLALYGRDMLTAGWQGSMIDPSLMRGALREVAQRQGREVNDWRDEQPGRMLHEAHTGPLEKLNYNPRSRYYGSITTSAFYPVVLAELWHWTGKREDIEPYLEPALRALQWLDEYADIDGDGFYEYQTRSIQGVVHQAWKDSADAIVYEDGSPVPTPIATCEEQAFVHIAKLFMSEVLWWLGRKHEARRLFQEASELKRRFNECFMMEEEQFLAVGLDPRKRLIRSITSNPGHCIAAGIVEPEHVRRIANRMLKPDMFSGWGIRTLSADNPAFNPYSYHRGSVWPVEQGTFALGLMRYGLHDCLHTIARAQFEAAALFEHHRLPETFSGHSRHADQPFPAFYLRANSPQAWSASSLFCLLQGMLGLYPYAPLKMLLVDPHLPEWLPEVTVGNLRVGEARVTMHFRRERSGRTGYRVTGLDGRLHVIRQPSPWSLTASYAERVKDMLLDLCC